MPPPFLKRYLIKCNNLVSMGPTYFIYMGNLKIMTRAYMPRHARACMFLTLSLYMFMRQVSIKSVSVCLLVCCLYMYMYVYPSACALTFNGAWLYMCVCVCVCVCARACVCIGPMCGSCILAIGPENTHTHTPVTKDPSSAHGSAWLSIHPSKIVKS